ncbi:MAG: alpha/beta fold hydrolase [Chlorobiaceae bacterium]|jgi:phospholipase/carboxylesterase|nr:alpha/beta fold hydrolase [Chlorobiaceae bacterium]
MLQRRNLSLTYLELAPANPEHAPIVIMLHGYGSNEKDLIQLAPMLPEGIRYISARAPVTLDFGMFGWFPIEFIPTGIIVDYDAAAEARTILIDFIREIISEYKPSGNKVYLMGFSQGAVMSYLAAFHAPELLHAVIALSGQLPEKSLPAEPVRQEITDLPFLVMHGIYDDILPIDKGRRSNEWLQQHVRDLVYREYPVAHQISEEGIRLLQSWLEEKQPAS